MTQEQKDLLLKDLCARLPYSVIVKYKSREKEGNVKITCSNIGYVTELGNGWWKECKPYLFPMSSMTKEQESYLYFNTKFTTDIFEDLVVKSDEDGNYFYTDLSDCISLIDWLLKNHFDIYGLIPKGLAIDATRLNIY